MGDVKCPDMGIQMEWWFNNSGLNLLKGVAGDEGNPLRLPDASIIAFLRSIPAARDSFNRLVPTMLEDEQIRLQTIASGSAKYLASEYLYADHEQAMQNRMGVHTTGKRGGTRRGGNA